MYFKSTFKYYKYIKYIAWYLSISTSTMVKFKDTLKNMYLSVLKYKYQCTWPHV